MGNESEAAATPDALQGGRSDALLADFLRCNPGAGMAAKSLRAGAEVAIVFTDLPGRWRVFLSGPGAIGFEPRAAADADFELQVPPQAVREICGDGVQDLGDLGVRFFEHLRYTDPQRRIRVTVHSGVIKLMRRGWLGLLAQGGAKVANWMGREGLWRRAIAPARIRR